MGATHDHRYITHATRAWQGQGLQIGVDLASSSSNMRKAALNSTHRDMQSSYKQSGRQTGRQAVRWRDRQMDWHEG
eukprot:10554962-Alexandrium_andersonii.AAC.1